MLRVAEGLEGAEDSVSLSPPSDECKPENPFPHPRTLHAGPAAAKIATGRRLLFGILASARTPAILEAWPEACCH